MDAIYLDNNATTRPAAEVVAAVREALDEAWANPSSVHRLGQAVRQRLELARASVAGLVGAKPRELVFTSGGTEANNLAIFGAVAPRGRGEGAEPRPVLITSRVEHSAVREPAEAFAETVGDVAWLPVDGDGVVSVDALQDELARAVAAGAAALVSVQWANNETGVVQPLAEIAAAVQAARGKAREAGKRLRLLLHVDGTQAVGKLPVDVGAAGIDLLSFAAHKFHGPKGVGALWVRTGVPLRPLVRGGPQEREKRGGTENVPGVVGFGVAAELAGAWLAEPGAAEAARGLRDRLERGIVEAAPGAVVNGVGAARLWNTTNVAFPGLEAEAVLLGLSERGVCASAGAACSSGSLEPSPVLLAMGLPEPVAHGSVRFSLSRWTTPAEVDAALRVVPEVVSRLRATMPMGA